MELEPDLKRVSVTAAALPLLVFFIGAAVLWGYGKGPLRIEPEEGLLSGDETNLTEEHKEGNETPTPLTSVTDEQKEKVVSVALNDSEVRAKIHGRDIEVADVGISEMERGRVTVRLPSAYIVVGKPSKEGVNLLVFVDLDEKEVVTINEHYRKPLLTPRPEGPGSVGNTSGPNISFEPCENVSGVAAGPTRYHVVAEPGEDTILPIRVVNEGSEEINASFEIHGFRERGGRQVKTSIENYTEIKPSLNRVKLGFRPRSIEVDPGEERGAQLVIRPEEDANYTGFFLGITSNIGNRSLDAKVWLDVSKPTPGISGTLLPLAKVGEEEVAVSPGENVSIEYDLYTKGSAPQVQGTEVTWESAEDDGQLMGSPRGVEAKVYPCKHLVQPFTNVSKTVVIKTTEEAQPGSYVVTVDDLSKFEVRIDIAENKR